MKRIVSISLFFSLLICVCPISSFATGNELSMEDFYSQISDIVCEYDYNNGGFASGSMESKKG